MGNTRPTKPKIGPLTEKVCRPLLSTVHIFGLVAVAYPGSSHAFAAGSPRFLLLMQQAAGLAVAGAWLECSHSLFSPLWKTMTPELFVTELGYSLNIFLGTALQAVTADKERGAGDESCLSCLFSNIRAESVLLDSSVFGQPQRGTLREQSY